MATLIESDYDYTKASRLISTINSLIDDIEVIWRNTDAGHKKHYDQFCIILDRGTANNIINYLINDLVSEMCIRKNKAIVLDEDGNYKEMDKGIDILNSSYIIHMFNKYNKELDNGGTVFTLDRKNLHNHNIVILVNDLDINNYFINVEGAASGRYDLSGLKELISKQKHKLIKIY